MISSVEGLLTPWFSTVFSAYDKRLFFAIGRKKPVLNHGANACKELIIFQ